MTDTEASRNAQSDPEESAPPSANGSKSRTDYSDLFGAPDFSSFIHKPKSRIALDYEKRVLSFLKAGMLGAINTGNYPDAATIIALGPSFAAATGELAAADEHVAGFIDLVTAPANPYALFAMTVIPFVSQLVRNHEPQLAELTDKEKRKTRRTMRKQQGKLDAQMRPALTVKIPFIKREIRLPFRIKGINVWRRFRAQTQDPQALTYAVFSDPKVLKALEKQGIKIVRQSES